METNCSRVPAKRVIVMIETKAACVKSGIVTPKRRRARSELNGVEVLRYRKSGLPGKRCSLAKIPVRSPTRRDVIVSRRLGLFVDTNLTRETGVFCDQSLIHQPFRESGSGR